LRARVSTPRDASATIVAGVACTARVVVRAAAIICAALLALVSSIARKQCSRFSALLISHSFTRGAGVRGRVRLNVDA
jgi:hypothetical protein